jgi:hypothetical protein
LDLINTNHPTYFRRIEVIPDLSDHDIVYAEIDILPVRNRQKHHQIPLYSKAKRENVRNDLTDIYHTLTTTENYVNDMWNIFQIKLEESMKSNIPHKTAKEKDDVIGYTEILRSSLRNVTDGTNTKISLETKMTLQSINNLNRRHSGNLERLTGNI